jgi:hypothetical protein
VRRESSTVVVLAGDVREGLLAELGRSGNAAVARAPVAGTEPGAKEPTAARPAWETGALAMREAARRQSAYVIVPDDPLAGVAAAWRAMWEVGSGPDAVAAFERDAAEALAAWRDKRFELPDYYLVVAGTQPGRAPGGLYLGPLRAARPHRVAIAAIADRPGQTAHVLDVLRSLPYGPWWPPLDELIELARRFYEGGLTETQPPAAS